MNSNSPIHPPTPPPHRRGRERRTLRLLKQSNRRAEIIPIILLRHRPRPINDNHIRAPHRAERPHVNLLAALHADHALLAALRRQARLVPVVEEGVQARAVDEDVGRGEDPQAPCFFAGWGRARAEVRVEVGSRGGEAAA